MIIHDKEPKSLSFQLSGLVMRKRDKIYQFWCAQNEAWRLCQTIPSKKYFGDKLLKYEDTWCEPEIDQWKTHKY